MIVHVHQPRTTGSLVTVKTMSELAAALGFTPVMRRKPCACQPPDCLCALDPFATARQGGIKLDVGDKHDFWTYMFMPDEKFSPYPLHVMRFKMGHDYVESFPNNDRSKTLNPNNAAFAAARDNHSNQLNPTWPELRF